PAYVISVLHCNENTMASLRYPSSIPYIIGTEAAERFSYYGMRSILTTFLVMQFFNPAHDPALQAQAEAAANAKTHLFVSLAYFMPVIGALLADTLFGRYRVIFYISILYCIGHLCLALFDQNLDGFSVGLLLLAIGAGGIKANVSAFVGDQFEKHNAGLMAKAYGWFYFSINSGAVISMSLVPWLLKEYGAKVAFGTPGIFMLLATGIFFAGRKQYREKPPGGFHFNLASIWGTLKSISRVLIVFAFIPFFWALWDQNESEWVLQAAKLDLQLFPGLTLLPAQVQTANPFFVLTLIPVFTYVIYPFLEKLRLHPTPLRKIGTGLVLTAVSFIVIAKIQTQIDAGLSPSVWWQILAYFLLTVAEILVSITGLEYAYTHSPPNLKSLMTALWLLTVSIGNLMVSGINQSIVEHGYFAQFTGAEYYWLFCKTMFAVSLVFIGVAYFLKERPYHL
ncbi:MAG TPA: MFS transporter, partial [Pseudomonadales bacterium]|nr:MFS transporter [Pseudomonadales bacterium]